MENIERVPEYNQVCVWPGTIVGLDNVQEFEEFMLDKFKARVQYLEEVKTEPDMLNGFPIEDTGGRNDLLFAIHSDDISRFAVPRLDYGIRWIEDVYGNGGGVLYPDRIAHYQIWNY